MAGTGGGDSTIGSISDKAGSTGLHKYASTFDLRLRLPPLSSLLPMKKTNLRLGCFETNSSSSHSISIHKGSFHSRVALLEGLTKTLPVNEHYTDRSGKEHKNCVVLTGGEFGWGEETYTDALTKANYLATYLGSTGHAKERKLLKGVICKATQADEVVIDLSDDAYIDHQSADVGSEALMSEEVLWDYLFQEQSVLVIDNDNK
jgi:hypothetical protein